MSERTGLMLTSLDSYYRSKITTLLPDLGLSERIREILHLRLISYAGCYLEMLYV